MDEGVGNRDEEARLGQGDGLVGWSDGDLRSRLGGDKVQPRARRINLEKGS